MSSVYILLVCLHFLLLLLFNVILYYVMEMSNIACQSEMINVRGCVEISMFYFPCCCCGFSVYQKGASKIYYKCIEKALLHQHIKSIKSLIFFFSQFSVSFCTNYKRIQTQIAVLNRSQK